MWKDGIIQTDEGDIIARPGMCLDELLQTSIGKTATVRPTGPGYRCVGFGPFHLGGKDWHANAYFYESCLTLLCLGLSSEMLIKLFGTDQPTGEDAAETVFYKNMMKDRVGASSSAKFSWGEAGAGYDLKGMYSSIYFRYEE